MSSSMPRAGGVLGAYSLKREVGTGGVAAVFIGEHAVRKNAVALKLLRPEVAADPASVAMFLAEPRAYQAAQSEHVLRILDVVSRGQQHFFATELVRGQTLSHELHGPRFPLARAVKIAVQLANALAAVHDAELLHRNVKPTNVFLTSRGDERDVVKLIDLAAVRTHGDDNKTQVPGTVVGSPAYMAPEQIRQEPGDRRMDVYAFGVVLFELCVGRRPFEGEVGEVVRAQLLTPAPRASSLLPRNDTLPRALDDLIMHCLAKAADDRPQSMHEPALALAALVDTLPSYERGPDDPSAEVFAVPRNASGFTTVAVDERAAARRPPSTQATTRVESMERAVRAATDSSVEPTVISEPPTEIIAPPPPGGSARAFHAPRTDAEAPTRISAAPPEFDAGDLDDATPLGGIAAEPLEATGAWIDPRAAQPFAKTSATPAPNAAPTREHEPLAPPPLAQGLTDLLPPPALRYPATEPKSRTPLIAAGVLVGLLVAVGGALLAFSGGDEPGPVVATNDPGASADGGTNDAPSAAPDSGPDAQATAPPTPEPATPPTPSPPAATPSTPATPVPAPPAPTPPAPIDVAFSSSPDGANVRARVMGRTRDLCVTPCTAALPAGSVEIEVRRSGFDTARRMLDVKPGASLEVSLDKRRARSSRKSSSTSVAKEGDLLNPF